MHGRQPAGDHPGGLQAAFGAGRGQPQCGSDFGVRGPERQID